MNIFKKIWKNWCFVKVWSLYICTLNHSNGRHLKITVVYNWYERHWCVSWEKRLRMILFNSERQNWNVYGKRGRRGIIFLKIKWKPIIVTINTYILRMFVDKRYWKDIICSLIREPTLGLICTLQLSFCPMLEYNSFHWWIISTFFKQNP